jgi:hypothetical protein
MKALTAILCLLVASAASAQTPPLPPPPPSPSPSSAPARDTPFLPPTGGGAISGKVMTTDERPLPIRNAVVTLRGDGFRSGWTFVTDQTGVFTFGALPPGRFTLAASRPGFPARTYGAPRPGRPGASIVLKDNTQVADLTIALPRGAVISGRVFDENGAPVIGARVVAGPVTIRNGERTTGFSSSDSTDDRGEYRIFGLAAGDYAVSVDMRQVFQNSGTVRYSSQDIDAVLKGGIDAARPGQAPPPPPRGQDLALTSIFYPSATSVVDASLIHVNAGEEHGDADLRTTYVPASSISGVLLDPDGKPPTNVILNLTQAGARSGAVFGRPSPIDGTFTFSGLTPGHYVVTARATTPANAGGGSMPPLWARSDVDLNGTPVTGVRVTLQPGAAISGAVAFESTTSSPPLSTARLALTPVLRSGDVGIGVNSVTMDKDRAFAFAGVPTGRYRIDNIQTTSTSPLWALKSAMLQGQDVLDEPFEVTGTDVSGLTITFTDKVSEINGSLEDATGRPAPDYYVIVFPTDQKYWFQNSRRIKTARPGLDGKYVVRGLPPGSYRIGAVTDVETNDWFESWFLQQLLPASAEITIAEGEKKIFPLKIGG